MARGDTYPNYHVSPLTYRDRIVHRKDVYRDESTRRELNNVSPGKPRKGFIFYTHFFYDPKPSCCPKCKGQGVEEVREPLSGQVGNYLLGYHITWRCFACGTYGSQSQFTKSTHLMVNYEIFYQERRKHAV